MYWTTSDGFVARSLNMPGSVAWVPPVVGTKIINSSLANKSRGVARASGVTMLFEPETARPVFMASASPISALRTAAVTLLAALLVARHPVESVAIIGAGEIGSAHAAMLGSRLIDLSELRLYDADSARACELADLLDLRRERPGVKIAVMAGAEPAIRGADLVVTCTTATRGYIPRSWLAPGVVVVNVSLDDLKEDAVLEADRILVDSWDLVRHDERRLLGRLYRAGVVVGPLDSTRGAARCVDAEIKDVLADPACGRRARDDVVVVNPFGMSVLDLALAREIYDLAREHGRGRLVTL